jgi:hypothetical protein
MIPKGGKSDIGFAPRITAGCPTRFDLAFSAGTTAPPFKYAGAGSTTRAAADPPTATRVSQLKEFSMSQKAFQCPKNGPELTRVTSGEG